MFFPAMSVILMMVGLIGCTSADTNSAAGNSDSAKHDSAAPVTVPPESPDEWKTEFAIMNRVLQLSDEESRHLQSAFMAREKEITRWKNENGARLQQLEAQMRSAARSKEPAGVRTATSQATPLRNELRELVADHAEKIDSILTRQNQLAWSAHLLSERVIDLMKDVSLTSRQIDQINAQAVLAVQDSAKQKNPEAFGYLELERFAESKILTADQLSVWEPIRKKHPMRSLY